MRTHDPYGSTGLALRLCQILLPKILWLGLLPLSGVLSPAAYGWSYGVHGLVCGAAYELTSSQGQALVDKYSDGDWAASCVWPDQVRNSTHRETYEYHFINVPKKSRRLDVSMEKDCAAYDCVHQAVARYASYLAAAETKKATKIEALKFIGHFVADLHQPLHVGYLEDRGGNSLKLRVKGVRGIRSLHSIWDSVIPGQMDLANVSAVASLVAAIDPANKAKWRSLDFESAVQESFDLARSHAYTLPNGQDVVGDSTLPTSYINRAKPVVRAQLEKAAIRLANLLHHIGAGRHMSAGRND